MAEPGAGDSHGANEAIARVGARMILLDPQDRVLLIEEAGTSAGTSWHHWLTPGGGVEAQESLAGAATREVIEETGLRVQLPADAVPVHRHRRLWSWQGLTYEQVDNIFTARVGAPFDVSPAALTPMELQTVVGARWWPLAELSRTTDTVIPSDLAGIVRAVLDAGDVARPNLRVAGRVLVLDHDERVLLINARQDPDGATTNWVAPGGGSEEHETPAQAAVRELFEETGISAELEPEAQPVARERAVFRVGSLHLDQTDHYFTWRVSQRPVIDRSRLSDLERRTVLEYRWWSVAELAATHEMFWPADLVQILHELAQAAVA